MKILLTISLLISLAYGQSDTFSIYRKSDECFSTAFSYTPDSSLSFPDNNINFSSSAILSIPLDLKVGGVVFWHDCEKWKIYKTVVMGNCPAGSKGIFFGIKTDAPSNYLYGLGVEMGLENKVRMYWYNDGQKATTSLKDMAHAFVPGDTLTFTIERNIDSMIFTAISSHETTSGVYIVSQKQSRCILGCNFPTLIQKFEIIFKQGNFTVIDFHVESSTGNKDLMIAGNSITQGYGAISTNQIWSQQIKSTYPSTTVFAGGGNTTALFLKTIPAIILAHPKQVAIELGINDINGGVSLSTLETQYASIVSQLVSAGITPVIELITPGSNANILTFNTWLRTSYSTTYTIVDFYSALRDASGGLDTRYTFDNLHLNQDGQNIQLNNFLKQWQAPKVVSMALTGAHTVRVVFDKPVTTTVAGWHFWIAGLYNNVTGVSGSGTDTVDFTFGSTALPGVSTYTGGYESFLGDVVGDSGVRLQSFKNTNLNAF